MAQWKTHKVISKKIAKDEALFVDYRKRSKAMLKAGQGSLEHRLGEASQVGILSAVQELIGQGANVIFADARGATSLLRACQGGPLVCVRALLDARARVNSTNSEGMHGLYMVSQVGHVEIVKCLLPQPDIDVKQTLENGETGLLVATCNDNRETVRALFTTQTSKSMRGTQIEVFHFFWRAVMDARRLLSCSSPILISTLICCLEIIYHCFNPWRPWHCGRACSTSQD